MGIQDSKQLTKAPLDDKMQVLWGQWVPRALYDQISRDTAERVPRLVPGKLYRLQDIYGDQAWVALGNAWVRRKAGRCFAHMVSKGIYPLTFVQYKRSATKRYLLNSG